MKLFGTIFNSFYFLMIAAKNSILDAAGVLDPVLITDIFALDSWILISLKSILASYRNQSVNSNGKKIAGCYEMRLCWFQIGWENSCALDEVFTFNQID